MFPKMEAASGASTTHDLITSDEEDKECYDGMASSLVRVDRYNMPPGFKFHPTDEEIIIYYLLNKVTDASFEPLAIGEVDLTNSEPWDLPRKAKMGENEWFFFCKKDRKYQTGMRTNRATESGYWKATGKDREIFSSKRKKRLVGMKKSLVFYSGRAPRGERTNWIVHEYRLQGNFPNHNFSTTSAKEKWVVCKVFHKKLGRITNGPARVELARSVKSVVHSLLDNPTLPPFRDHSLPTENPTTSSFVTQEDDEFKADCQIQKFQHNQNNLIAPPPSIISSYNQYCSPHNLNPNPVFNPDSFTPYQAPSPVYHQNFYADSRNDLETYNMYMGGLQAETMCKMEDYSLDNSIVSHSEETAALSNESKKAISDQEFEGVSFGPSVSDHDFEYSLWSY